MASDQGFAERIRAGQQLQRELFARLDAGEAVDFEALRPTLGCKLEPMSWGELQAVLEDGSPEALATLGRTPLDLKAYWEFSEQVIKKQFASATDYLYCKVFGLPSVPGSDGRQQAVVPADFGSTLQVVWRPNDFPYSFEPGMEHHNVWASRPLSREELQQVIAEHRPGWETQWYINPPQVMSVPGLWHAHVISRRPPPP